MIQSMADPKLFGLAVISYSLLLGVILLGSLRGITEWGEPDHQEGDGWDKVHLPKVLWKGGSIRGVSTMRAGKAPGKQKCMHTACDDAGKQVGLPRAAALGT